MISCRGDAKMAWAGRRLVCCRGETLGYRTLYVWIADEDLMITVQTNSQPPDGTDKINDAVTALYEICSSTTVARTGTVGP